MSTSTVDTSQDVEDILKVHHAWVQSNDGLIIEDMIPNFADPGYLQYNLNGHTYRSVHEKVKLWEGLLGAGLNLTDMQVVEEPEVYVEGGLAYLTAIWSCYTVGQGSSGNMEMSGAPITFRITEVYRKDDGKGNPVWKIWHFHCSLVADPSSPKYPQDA